MYRFLLCFTISVAIISLSRPAGSAPVSRGRFPACNHSLSPGIGIDTSCMDALVLSARHTAWKGEYDEALGYLDVALGRDSCYHDALLLQTDIWIWKGDTGRAIEIAEHALHCHPGNELFLANKARAFYMAGMTAEAEQMLRIILETDPRNSEALTLKKLMGVPGVYYYRENNHLLAGYTGESFRDPYHRQMHVGTVGYTHATGRGPFTAKLNFANIYIEGTGMTRYPSLQYEFETYPSLSDEGYLLINYAFSGATVFPGHRGALELFRTLAAGFEASLGIRAMYWNRGYLFYTGSLGKYSGNYLFMLRPWILPGENGMSGSCYFSARRYFRTADDYAGIIIGYGSSPDNNFIDPGEIPYLNSPGGGVELSLGIGRGYLIDAGIRYEHEERLRGSYRGVVRFRLGLRYYL